MSLWTPGGEVPVNRNSGADQSRQPEPAPDPDVVPGMPDLDELSPEDRVRAEEMMAEMAEVQAQIAAAPASQIIGNHLVGFYELAAIHLQQDPPDFRSAQLAIDALAAVLDTLGNRLGEVLEPMSQALNQLQMAFVQLRTRAEDGS